MKTAFGHDPIGLAFSSLGPIGGGLDVRDDDVVGLPTTVVAAPLVHAAARTNTTSGKSERLPIVWMMDEVA